MSEYDPVADLYDLEYVHGHDLEFWMALASREGSPVVEWGSGTGRIAAPLAQAGYEVTGVELSVAMLELADRKSSAVEWVAGDMRHVKLEKTFQLGICAFNSFLCLLSPEDMLAFLENARIHLRPGGLLGIEVSAFSPEELSSTELRHDLSRYIPDGALERFSVSHYDAASQLLEMRLFYELYDERGHLQDKRAHGLTIRVVSRAELELFLKLSGFELETVYGGFESEPFTSACDHLIALARRPI